MSPRLPQELWSQVFLLTQEDGLTKKVDLVSVCKEWLHFIEGTPQFWDRILMTFAEDFEDVSKIDKHLRLSRRLPLHLTITPAELPLECIRVAMWSLVQDIDRVQTLYINHTDLIVINHIIFQLFPPMHQISTAQILQRLVITCTGSRTPVATLFTLNPCQTNVPRLPQLRELYLPSCAPPLETSDFLADLTVLKLDTNGPISANILVADSFWIQILKVLKHTPKLEEFRYCRKDEVNLPEYEPVSPKDIVSLDRLRTIYVTAPGVGIQILRHLRMSALVCLRLDGYRNDGSHWLSFVHDVVANLPGHAPSVKSITLCELSSRNCAPIFPRFLELEHLAFYRCSIKDDSFDCEAQYPACSSLKWLELYECNEIIGRPFNKFIQSDRHSLQGLVVYDCMRVSLPDLYQYARYTTVTARLWSTTRPFRVEKNPNLVINTHPLLIWR